MLYDSHQAVESNLFCSNKIIDTACGANSLVTPKYATLSIEAVTTFKPIKVKHEPELTLCVYRHAKKKKSVVS